MLPALGGAAGGASLFGAGSSGDAQCSDIHAATPFAETFWEPGKQLAFAIKVQASLVPPQLADLACTTAAQLPPKLMPVSTKLASETVPLMGTGGAASSGRIPRSDCAAASASPYSCHQHALQHQTDSLRKPQENQFAGCPRSSGGSLFGSAPASGVSPKAGRS